MIEIFSRQTFFSFISQHKKRFSDFSHEHCYHNLLKTSKGAHLTFLFDAAKGPLESHFLKNETNHQIIQIHEGTEAGSFLRLLDYVEGLDLPLDTVLYFVEDDYIHRPGWIDILLEGFQIPEAEYITLYDHKDKYFLYPRLTSRIFTTTSCHWRSTPSTTNTFAMRWKTLKRDLNIHRSYSKGRTISADHEKFCFLEKKGALLISALPGWSTHAEPDFASPCVDWSSFLK